MIKYYYILTINNENTPLKVLSTELYDNSNNIVAGEIGLLYGSI